MKAKATTDKPVISEEARARILTFVSNVERLERLYDVEIAVQDDTIALRDVRRKNKWINQGYSYGAWDAQIFGANRPKRMRVKNVKFEDFGGWDK